MSIYGNISVFEGLSGAPKPKPIEDNHNIYGLLFENVVPFRRLKYSDENLINEFGKPIIKKDSGGEDTECFVIETPLNVLPFIYIRRQAIEEKFLQKDNFNRRFTFGLIRPTITNPNAVIYKDDCLLFYKTFVKGDGTPFVFNFVVSEIGKEDNFLKTTHPRTRWQELIKNANAGVLIYPNGQKEGDGDDTLGRCETGKLPEIAEMHLHCILPYTVNSLKGLGKLPPMDSDSGNAFDIDWVSLDDIFTDEKNFQNRADKYSAKSVRSIINAVDNGTFNWFAFDPITLWRNPKNDKLYILSGHSRTQAFRELSKTHPDKEVDGLNFNYIPAKIFEGSFADAKNLALNSNALGTPETLTERAEYYRARREATNKADWRTLKKQALRENNGQIIWDLSFLPADGVSLQALKSFKADGGQDSTENFLRLATICQWIGKAFQIYDKLSNAHDQELFKFLNGGGYGSRSGQYFSFTALNDRLEKLYKQNVAKEDKTNSRGEYTEPFQIAAYKKDDKQLDILDEMKQEVNKAEKELKAKLKEMREAGADKPQLFRIVTPLYNSYINKLHEYWQTLDRVPRKDTRQQSIFGMFGIGRTANNELYNNNDILECRGLTPTYKILPSYDHFFAPAEADTAFAGFGLDDTKKLIADYCRKYWKDCKAIAEHLKGDSLLQSCFNLWHWMRHNIRYEYDRDGREEVRSPRRVWADRERGVDCDCLSVFAWCVLYAMGYNPAFELVAFKNKPEFSHIFINCDGVVVDRVWFIFNSRPPGVTKRELFKVNINNDLGKLF